MGKLFCESLVGADVNVCRAETAAPAIRPPYRLLLPVGLLIQSLAICLLASNSSLMSAQSREMEAQKPESASVLPSLRQSAAVASTANVETTEDWNRRLQEHLADSDSREYRIGSEDVLDVSVFEAPEMNREVRVSARGEISLPLLGAVEAADMTPQELETELERLLREKYMKDPHVAVFVRDMQSHPVSVMGAARKPGVFQIRGTKSLLEVLALAGGLADDAGESVVVLHGATLDNAPQTATAKPGTLVEHLKPAENTGELGATPVAGERGHPSAETAVQVNLKDLLDSADPQHNPEVYPGDIVKVSRAGVVYVVGAVRRPGGFTLKTNEKISVLQALALSEGLTRTAAHGGARIIHTDEQSGTRKETPIDLSKVLAGKAPDPMLGARDILFVPDSVAKSTTWRGTEAALQALTGLAIFRW